MVENKFEIERAIGGYFSLELSTVYNGCFHREGIYLNSGRNALEYILRSIPIIRHLYIPYYTCDVVLEPINKLGISYSFYCINERLELADEIHLNKDEYLLVNNYFGIKDAYIRELSVQYGRQLIVDNAQALYAKPLEGIKTIYSPRKFVGIPDGGIAYIENGLDVSNMERDISYNRCSHLLKRLDLGAESGYNDFRENSSQLVNQPIKRMSNLTSHLLHCIDWNGIKEKRWNNFRQLHESLCDINQLYIPSMDSFSCPMVYPLYVSDVKKKENLIKNKIFVATYWPNVLEWIKGENIEYQIANYILSLPIDQRYGKMEMKRIVKILFDNI